MAGISLDERKKKIVSQLAIYRKRRAKMAKEMGVNPLGRAYSERDKRALYWKKTKNLRGRIDVWQKSLRRVSALIARIRVISKAVKSFTGIKLDHIEERNKNYRTASAAFRLARSLFFTFGLENGCKGSDLCRYVGRGRKEALKGRRKFKASFKTVPENRQLWKSFNEFFEANYKLPKKCT